MHDTKKETILIASEYWQLGLLQALYKKKLITDEEYKGITQIVKKDYSKI